MALAEHAVRGGCGRRSRPLQSGLHGPWFCSRDPQTLAAVPFTGLPHPSPAIHGGGTLRGGRKWKMNKLLTPENPP
jgi:hypothetical protein